MSILPTGWERVITPDGLNACRPYYVNHNDGTTQWDPPDPPDAAGSSHSRHPEASTALVPTHLRGRAPVGGVFGIGTSFFYMMQTVLLTVLHSVSPTREVPAWHDDRTSTGLELPRRVPPRLDLGPGTVVPRLEPGPVTVVSTGEPSIPVSNDQFMQCLATYAHADACTISPGDEFMQAWLKDQREYFDKSKKPYTQKGDKLRVAWSFTQLSPLFLSNCRKTQSAGFVNALAQGRVC